MGYTVDILERPAEIRGERISEVMQETCTAWDAWSRSNVVNQIDAGI